MSKWIIKTAVQRVISWMPQSYRWNLWFQRNVTRGLHVSVASFEDKLNNCRTHLENYRKHSPAPKDSFTALELGTGWWPIPPVGLFLCGAKEIWSYDIVPLLQRDTFERVLELYVEYSRSGKLVQFLPAVRPDRVAMLPGFLARSKTEPPAAVLEAMNIHAQVRDATQTGLPAGTIDLIYSNACFEHIPLPLQAALHAEFKRVAAPGAVASHFVGIGDQQSNFDRSITIFNYLKYPSWQWRFLNNPIIPQTRLRASEYRSALEKAGYEVLSQRNIHGPKEDFAKIKIAPEFRRFSEEDLLTCYTWLVSRPV
jgi:hypothetical protein